MKKRKRLDNEQSKKLAFEKRLFQLKLNAGVFDHKKTEEAESPGCVGKRLRMARSPMPLAVDNLDPPAPKVPTLNIVLSQQKSEVSDKMKRVRGKTTERASKRSNKRKDGSRGTPPRNGGAAGRSGTFSLYNSQRDRSKESISSLLS